jgi:(2R)-ethylmalonyl-CoA mutase
VGGIIPDADGERLRREGIAAVYTPKDFELDNIMSDLIDLVDHQHAAE